MGNHLLLFKILLLTLISREVVKIIIVKIKVRSATFEPNKVAKPKAGIPCKAEEMAIKVSGKIEMSATIRKPMVYFGSRNKGANW